MFDRLLIPLDGSLPATSALLAADLLADRLGASIHVLTLLQSGRRGFGLGRIIERQVARIEHDPKVDVRAVSYSVPEDIADEFDSVERTLVVMSSWARGRSAVLVGNVAEDVLRLTRRPILLLGPQVELGDRWLDGPMLIATDGSPFGDSIAHPAADLAAAIGIAPTLVSVIDTSRVPAGIGTASEANAVAGLARSLAGPDGPPVDFDVLHGPDPAAAITAHAEQTGAAIIAMSTHGRAGLTRLTLDSVAMDVVRHARCPVYVGRPPSSDGEG